MTYTPKIDVYGLGLLFAYLLLGRELYGRIMPEGRPNPALQLAEIRRVLGGECGERVALTVWLTTVSVEVHHSSNAQTLFKEEKIDVSEHTVDLLAGLLAIEPERRLSADEARHKMRCVWILFCSISYCGMQWM
jgi:serine/threonine protein kinase